MGNQLGGGSSATAMPMPRANGICDQSVLLTGSGVETIVAFGVLAYCPWEQRAAAACLCRELRVALGHAGFDGNSASSGASSGVFWQFLCERLAEEHQVYVPLPSSGCGSSASLKGCPPPPIGVSSSWEKLFRELFKRAHGGTARRDLDVDEADAEVFSIDVAARFRPARTSATEAQDNASAVVLPLHQKVQLVKEQFGISSKEAVAMIMKNRAKQRLGARVDVDAPLSGSLFQECVIPEGGNNKENQNIPNKCEDPPGGDSPSSKSEEKNEGVEVNADARSSILAVREDNASVLAVTRQSGLRDFRFNQVFDETSSQENIYERSARRLVVEFLNGKSASIICYGQTGSGKTFTMFSPPPSSSAALDMQYRGIVPRACDEILVAVQRWRSQGHEARLGVSYVEIFGSEVSDLLHEGRVVGQDREGRYDAVRATDRVGHRYVLDGHTECTVDSWAQVDKLLQAGDEAKRRAATAMNERSTRAHSVLVLSLTKRQSHEKGPASQSRFYFADLGGSEQVSKSKTDEGTMAPVTVVGGVEQSRISWQEYYRHRQRIQETLHINKGLFALKRVVEALHRRSNLAAEGASLAQLPYVPYQDSKLTMMLQEALGGASRTLIVTTATMDPEHTAESLQTLRFAETCASVQKRSDMDQAASVRLALDQLAQDINEVEQEIRRKERWETQRVKRADIDTVAGAFGDSLGTYAREETVVKTVLVGAEAERKRLEWLLQRQRDLEGLNGAAAFGKHYEDMSASTARDGGLGADWRERDKFQSKMKARDFEDDGVLADALRFLFRKADGARDAFGENENSVTMRLPRAKIPAGYFRIAHSLRKQWEDRSAAGLESRPFGKAALDRCQDWSKLLKSEPACREEQLEALLKEVGYVPQEADQQPLPHELDQEF